MQILKNINDFFQWNDALMEWRRKVFPEILSSPLPRPDLLLPAIQMRKALMESGVSETSRLILKNQADDDTILNVSYELLELERDIIFLEEGIPGLLVKLKESIPELERETLQLSEFFTRNQMIHIITDRDGTINPYANLYRTSGQSLWNGYLLEHVGKRLKGKGVILTSGPLNGPGVSDLTLTAPDRWILAASKGREYLNETGTPVRQTAEEKWVKAFNELKNEFLSLLDEPRWQIFSSTGSGFQTKYLQLTVAQQDIYHSIDSNLSRAFRERVEALVREKSREDLKFHIEDTGYDLEILPVAGTGENSKEFDKGDGLAFLAESLQLSDEPILLCGDTSSDISMIREAGRRFSKISTVFVTDDPELRQRVRVTDAPCEFVQSPETLVIGLYHFFVSRD